MGDSDGTDRDRGAGLEGRDDRGLAAGSGIYLVRMTAAGYAQVRKVAMVR